MRILLATDGSIESELAEAVAEKLPISSDSNFSVSMVVNAAPLLMAGVVRSPFPGAADGVAESWRIQRDLAQQTVARVSERIRRIGFLAEGFVLEGETSDELVSFAEEEHCDLVVSGSGVSGDLAAFFLGSVSRMLALNSRASVLIGRHYGDAPAEGSYQRIKNKRKLDLVVAVDGSKGSDVALETLAGLAGKPFGNITLVAVEPLRDYGLGGADMEIPLMEADSSWIEELLTIAAKRIERSCESVRWLIGFGRPSVEIARIATLQKADLVMIGANRHGTVERLLLGSCAYETATSAPCSVLILRKPLPFKDGDEK